MGIPFFLWTLLAGGAALFIWTHGFEPNWFRLREVTLKVGKPLPRPIRILHLSDLHFVKRRFFLERFFGRLSKLALDFVFVTGDLIDRQEGIEVCVEELKKLKPQKGIYAVLGNHDYRVYPPFEQFIHLLFGIDLAYERKEADELKHALRQAGIRVLLNENVAVDFPDGRKVVLIGIDDPVTKRANPKAAFQGIENNALHLTLVHSPIAFPSLRRHKIDAAFAGHTHGGQVRLPGIGALPLIRTFEPIVDSTDRYGFFGVVSHGMAAQPLSHLRFFCRPEALLIRIEGS